MVTFPDNWHEVLKTTREEFRKNGEDYRSLVWISAVTSTLVSHSDEGGGDDEDGDNEATSDGGVGYWITSMRLTACIAGACLCLGVPLVYAVALCKLAIFDNDSQN